MYLTRIKLDTSRRNTMRALVSPNLFHGAIESSEMKGRTRKLWRVDSLHGQNYILILSENEIDFSSVADQFGTGEQPESRCYDGLLERVGNGSRWRFKLKANPVVYKKNSDSPKERGKPIAHITSEYQEKWLIYQAEKNGFCLEEGSWLVTESKWYSFKKGTTGHNIRMLSATYEGILTVNDAELFREALTHGIGREKSYGLGMLTVMGIK